MPVNISFLYRIYAKVVNLLQISVNDRKHFAEKKTSTCVTSVTVFILQFFKNEQYIPNIHFIKLFYFMSKWKLQFYLYFFFLF